MFTGGVDSNARDIWLSRESIQISRYRLESKNLVVDSHVSFKHRVRSISEKSGFAFYMLCVTIVFIRVTRKSKVLLRLTISKELID